MSENKITPEEVLLGAFEYFQTDTLSLESLINIALAANCSSPEIAQGVLHNLVQMDVLSWKKEENQVLFTLKPSSTEDAH